MRPAAGWWTGGSSTGWVRPRRLRAVSRDRWVYASAASASHCARTVPAGSRWRVAYPVRSWTADRLELTGTPYVFPVPARLGSTGASMAATPYTVGHRALHGAVEEGTMDSSARAARCTAS